MVDFEPVELDGTTVTTASLSSAKNYIDMNAPKGSVITVTKAEGFIPYIEKVIERPEKTKLTVPTKCPLCNEILAASESFKKYKNEPAPFVNVDSYKDSSVCIVLKVWVDSSEYWNMYYYIQEEVRRQFANNNIEIPFNQLDVHLDK